MAERKRRKALRLLCRDLTALASLTGITSLLVIFTEAPVPVRVIGWTAVAVTALLITAILYIQSKLERGLR